MIKIGRGFYYNVYDLQNGRVLKTPRSTFSQILFLLRYILKPKTFIAEFKRAPYKRKAIEKEWGKTQWIIENIPSNLTGNPKVISASVYEQDKAMPLGNLIHILPEDQIKQRIEEYIELTFESWKCGIADTVFNFSLNTGVDKHDKLIFLDLNEFTRRKEEILFELNTLRFSRASSFLRFPKGELKEYIYHRFQESLTDDNLEKYWGTKMPSSI